MSQFVGKTTKKQIIQQVKNDNANNTELSVRVLSFFLEKRREVLSFACFLQAFAV